MRDEDRTKEDLTSELETLLKRVADLENGLKLAEDAIQECKKNHRSLIETIPHGIQECDTSGTITFSNTALCGMIGYGMDEFVGKKIWDTLDSEEDKQRLKNLFLSIVEEQPALTSYISRLHTKDGRPITLQIDWNYKRSQQGDVTGFVSVITDITERKHMEEELLKARKLESIGILAGGIAHDFNNLLTAILGNISLSITQLNPDSRIFQRLSSAEKACESAKELSNRLITFSKGGEPFRKRTRIHELLKETVSLSLGGSNVSADYSLSGNLYPVEIDEGHIKQVIRNIVINAKEAMPKGGILKVCAENMAVAWGNHNPLREGIYVKVSISDNGDGIPDEILSCIFDPYFTTKGMGAEKGRGLGLAICYSIIKKHNGLITVDSKKGTGATFHIYLPATETQTTRETEIEERPASGKGKILIMDDEAYIRDIAGQILKHLGYEVAYANSGNEAVELYKRSEEAGESFDAVILDLTVHGGMGGDIAIKRLLEIDPDVRGIVSSGYAYEPVMTDFKEYGFVGAIAKPYSVRQLGETLNRVLLSKKNS